ncbi:MAG TPA: DUF883 family protein [Candidatus Binatia bacterium]|nr:DUF883 family protein [Candidatus Binatia bacterium]
MTATREANKLAGDLESLVEGSEELLEATASNAGEKVNSVRHRLTAALESAKATCSRLQDKTVQVAKASDQVVREHPYESIGVAFGVGLLIGVLVARR